MLNKEECKKALEHFEKCYWNQDCSYGAMSRVRKDLDILNKLIHEHFSNPPLTWEELKECNVVYDKKLKKYRLINELLEDGFIYFTYTTDTRIGEYYEPNRFYRKEVQE